MPTQTTVTFRILSDGNTQGTIVNTATDSAGNPSKLGFFGTTPVAQPTPAGNVTTVAAGSTTTVFVNTSFSGGTGATAYTVGDLVAVLKAHGLIKA